MKVALVYDRINKWGGAERVLLALNEIFPDAPLYTAVYDSEKAPWAKVFPKVIPSFLQKIPFMQDKHELLGFLTPIAFETFNFDGFDLVISVTSEAAKGIITKPGTFHICYCLTPTRYLWSHYEIYFKNLLIRVIAKPVVNYLKNWDKIGARRPDMVIAISHEVQRRIKKYYDVNSDIIYPPVNIDEFSKSAASNNGSRLRTRYYLLVSRLVYYKRVDLAINVFNKLGLPLIVIGKGAEEKRLRSLAGKNIKFIDYLTDKKLAEYYQNAKALIFPGEEDFGIVLVESLASGTPAIAYNKGGALDIIENGKTGVFFNSQNEDSLIAAIKQFEKMQFNKVDLVKSAARFSAERFKKQFTQKVAKLETF